MLEVYHEHTSVCAAKVRFALEEKGLPWRGHLLDLSLGESHTQEYLNLNPLGVVPTLVHDGTVIIESTIINEYIEDTFSDTPLRPADSAERARMRLWTKQLDDSIHSAVGVVTFCIAYRYQRLNKPREEIEKLLAAYVDVAKRDRHRDILSHGIDAACFEPALRRFQKLLVDIESALDEKPWLAGGTFSLADIGFAPYIVRLDLLQLAHMWDDLPNFSDWYARLGERPAFRKGVVDWNDAAPDSVSLMEHYGRECHPRIQAILSSK